ncbi:MAG: antitoxin Xre/MbcA/ParS toxin-binding domain-containing protein [Rhodospirillales bacterium]
MPAPARKAAAETPAPPMLGEGAYSPEKRAALSAPGFRAFLNIAAAWKLSEREKLAALGEPGRSTFYKWAHDAAENKPMRLSIDVLMRISAVLGVHKALQVLFLTPEEGAAWLKTPNAGAPFGGGRPIGLLFTGRQDDMLLLRRYLDARRGGLFAAPTEHGFEHEMLNPEDVTIVG